MRELVERLYQALALGDRAGVEALLAPEFAVTMTAGLPFGIGGTHTGDDAIEHGWWAIGRNYALTVEPAEWIECADGRLLVAGVYVGYARATRRPVRAAFTHLVASDGSRLTSLVQVTDSAQWQAAVADR
jgi:2-(1,2-epoxy-1,2-dihydrophenyl)acetyl-CoA isomerase